MFGLNKKEKSSPVIQDQKTTVASGGGVLVRPVVSEKAMALESSGKYVFRVEDRANKKEVKKEVERKYGVRVVGVNITMVKPREKFFRGKIGRKPGFKKAIVKLAAGQKIETLPK